MLAAGIIEANIINAAILYSEELLNLEFHRDEASIKYKVS